jgi:hypothetical protein
VVQPDGKIVVGGNFTTLGGGGTGATTRVHLGRLNADGSIDATFDPGIPATPANLDINALALQTDGKILVGGFFSTLGGAATRNNLGRLNADGSLDTSFDPGANDQVYALAMQADGKIVIGGEFTTLGGGGTGTMTRNRIGRLTNTGAAIQSLSVTGGGSVVTWSRSGAGPEVWRVTFESSTDGVTYTLLGSGARVPGGWQLTGLSLATNQNLYIRARGYYQTGYFDGSGSIVELLGNVYIAVTPPCTFSLSAPSASVPATFSTGSVTLTASAPSCAWTAVSNNGFIDVTSAGAGTGTTTVTWEIFANPITSARTGTITIAGLTFTITQAGAITGRRIPNDFNHDGLSDLGVFRASLGRFLIDGQPNTDWGAAGDMPVAGDFNGDGNPDIAVFRPANGTWYIKDVATIVWGAPGDIPVPGDYDGNGTTDIAVFRPSAGIFYIRGGATIAWGLSGDLPVIGDYNGDGSDDIAVYRPSNGTWYVRNITTFVFGFAADVPVPADYTGDGLTDIAVFRPATGTSPLTPQFCVYWSLMIHAPVAGRNTAMSVRPSPL